MSKKSGPSTVCVEREREREREREKESERESERARERERERERERDGSRQHTSVRILLIFVRVYVAESVDEESMYVNEHTIYEQTICTPTSYLIRTSTLL
jgi:hypothetical protein